MSAWQTYLKDALILAIVLGCVWIILTPSDSTESNAAFGILGVITAKLLP